MHDNKLVSKINNMEGTRFFSRIVNTGFCVISPMLQTDNTQIWWLLVSQIGSWLLVSQITHRFDGYWCRHQQLPKLIFSPALIFSSPRLSDQFQLKNSLRMKSYRQAALGNGWKYYRRSILWKYVWRSILWKYLVNPTTRNMQLLLSILSSTRHKKSRSLWHWLSYFLKSFAFSEICWILSAWVTRPERPKGLQLEVGALDF